jgi:transposase
MAVIPPKTDRARPIPCDFAMYRWRHLVENFFCNLKEFRRIATRYDKTDSSFAAAIYLVGAVMALK